MRSSGHVSPEKELLDELEARFAEARRKGRTQFAEGVPGNVCPYTDSDLAQCWLAGWWDGFKNDRKTA